MAYYKFVPVSDAGIFDVFNGTANGTVSGGMFVNAVSGAQGTALSSGGTWDPDYLLVNQTSTSGTDGPPVGIALKNVSSGALCPFIRQGEFILESSAAITAGLPVVSTQSGTLYGQVGLVKDGEEERSIGRAYTQGADGEFVVVRLNL